MKRTITVLLIILTGGAIAYVLAHKALEGSSA